MKAQTHVIAVESCLRKVAKSAAALCLRLAGDRPEATGADETLHISYVVPHARLPAPLQCLLGNYC